MPRRSSTSSLPSNACCTEGPDGGGGARRLAGADPLRQGGGQAPGSAGRGAAGGAGAGAPARVGMASNVQPLAVALATPGAGLPRHHAGRRLAALEELDATGVAYRVAVVVAPRAAPAPGPGGASLAMLTAPGCPPTGPGAQAMSSCCSAAWTGAVCCWAPTGQVEVEVFDTAARPRPRPDASARAAGLEGWDTVGTSLSGAGHRPEPGGVRGLPAGRRSPALARDRDELGRQQAAARAVQPHTPRSAVSSTGNWAAAHRAPRAGATPRSASSTARVRAAGGRDPAFHGAAGGRHAALLRLLPRPPGQDRWCQRLLPRPGQSSRGGAGACVSATGARSAASSG